MADALTERFIQQAVADRLNDRHYRRRSAYVSTEVYTRLKRADVLLSFMRARNRPYVVVVEAKSRTTIHQLRLKTNPGRAEWTGRLLSLLLIVGLSAALGYQWYFNALNTLLLLTLFLLGSVALTALVTTLRLRFARSISAIEQLGRYPANESWIAVGDDTFVRPEEYRTLLRQCRKNGVGLIVVDGRGRLALRQLPRPRHVFNNYLGRYGKHQSMLAEMERAPVYGATPAERRQNRRRYLNIGLLLAVVGLLVLLVYEDNYGPVVPDPFSDPRFHSPAGVSIGRSAAEPPATAPPEDPAPADPDPACPYVPRNQPTYVIVDALLTPAAARQRVARLTAAGLRGQAALSVSCLRDPLGSGRLAVYTGTTYATPEKARAAQAAYRALLTRLHLPILHAEAMLLTGPDRKKN
ncbi:hypothetical protein [Lewinella sp. IMCC34183]|uniref:hypothetical protein n=1 Tax=Lewinella sp. IMCC34183 TaxID=2248762 RepID=UPI000E24BC63|nr:hypothetical protein [Lewinella sp. IMCC34183]